MMKKTSRKAVIVGTGFVGVGVAYSILNLGIVNEMVLVDVNEDKAEGEARDLFDGASYVPNTYCRVWKGDYSECKDADVVVITAGVSQKPGQSRLELVDADAKIMKSVVKDIMASGFDGVLVVVSNPVDVLSYVAWQTSGLPSSRVIGTGTALDSTRLRTTIARRLNVDPHDVCGYVIGEHGDSEIPVWSHVTIGGKPILDMIKDNEGVEAKVLEEMHQLVRDEAYYIIDRKGHTDFGIGLTTARIVKAILNDEHAILAVSTYFNGEYDVEDIYTGIPAVITQNGVERIIKLHLTDDEYAHFHQSVDALREVANTVKE